MTAKQRAFLAAFAKLGNIAEACVAAATGRRSHYDWIEQPEYKAAFEDAKEEAADLLEGEARRRAQYGVREPVVYQGELCYEKVVDPETGEITRGSKPLVIRKYSDVLLIFLLKGLRPEKYRDNMHVSGSLQVNIAERLIAARQRLKKKEEEPPCESSS